MSEKNCFRHGQHSAVPDNRAFEAGTSVCFVYVCFFARLPSNRCQDNRECCEAENRTLIDADVISRNGKRQLRKAAVGERERKRESCIRGKQTNERTDGIMHVVIDSTFLDDRRPTRALPVFGSLGL